MNVDRRLPNGHFVPQEMINKSQIYVTTAGWKNSYAYEKLVQLLVRQVINPKESFIMGGTYRIPIMQGLLAKNFVQELQLSDTYTDDSFSRQYESIWSGDAENAFFSSEVFDKHRELKQPQYQFSGRSSKSAYYVIGVDVGRKGCSSQACVFKVTPQAQGSAIKSLVNIYTWDEQHFERQAINLKKLYYKYRARRIAIDANGLGIGLIDNMVMSQIDPQTGQTLPPFGVDNDQQGFYKKFKTADMETDAMFLIKANAPINTEAYSYAQAQLSSGKIKMLIDVNQAKMKLMSTNVGKEMSPDQRAEYLKPFQETNILREQMLNLVEDNEGVNIILKQNSRAIKKDKFSAFIYGLYFIKQEQERNKKKKNRNLTNLMLYN